MNVNAVITGEESTETRDGTAVSILWTDLNESPREFPRCALGLFPESEVRRIGRFIREADRRLRYAAVSLLTDLVGGLPGIVSGVFIDRNRSGRPQILGVEHADISVSHSGEIVVCALSTRGRIGIDIELIRPVDIDDFIRVFPASLWEWFHTDDASGAVKPMSVVERFFHAWTRLESVIKAHGEGLSSPLGDFVFDDRRALLGSETWRLHTIPVSDGYVCSMAVCGTINRIDIHRATCLK